MRRFNILILSRKFSIYSTRRLVEEIHHLDATPLLWDPAWPVSKCATSYEALVPRLGSFHFPEALASLKALTHPGCLVMNDDRAYYGARNKWRAYQFFREHKIPTPYTELISLGKTISWKSEFPCILKLPESSKGEGVHLISNESELASMVETLNEDYLIQEAFPESFGEDIRVFVVGSKVIASMKRKSLTDFRSNLSLGAQAEPCTLTALEESLALQICEGLNLKIAGVDILRTHKGSLILEANPCPGLEGIEKYTRVNVARAIIQYIKETLARTL